MPTKKVTVWKVRGENFLSDLIKVVTPGGNPNILLPYINQLFEDHGHAVTDSFYDALKDKNAYNLFLETQKKFVEILPLWEHPNKNKAAEMAVNFYDGNNSQPKNIRWTGTAEGLAGVIKEFRKKDYFKLKVTDPMIKEMMQRSFKVPPYSLAKITAAKTTNCKRI